jgi:hypothetical protein
MLLKAHRMQQIARKMAQLEASLAGAGGELHELREELEDSAAATGVELATIRRLDADTLTGALAPGGGPAPGRLWVAAEVLFLDGLAALGEGRAEAARRRLGKARHLYGELGDRLELPEGAVAPADRLERIDDLLEGAD